MYVSVLTRKSKGKETKYVYLLESVRDPKTGKNTKRTVKNFGRLDLLEAEEPGFLERLKKKYKSRTDRSIERQQKLIAIEKSFDAEVSDEELYGTYCETFVYGHYVLKRLWSDVLKLHDQLSYLKNHKYKLDFDLNDLISGIVYRIALGCQALHALNDRQDGFLGEPKAPHDPALVVTSLDILKENRDMLIGKMNRAITAIHGEDRLSTVFFKLVDAAPTSLLATVASEARSSFDRAPIVLMFDKHCNPVDFEIVGEWLRGTSAIHEVTDSLRRKYGAHEGFLLDTLEASDVPQSAELLQHLELCASFMTRCDRQRPEIAHKREPRAPYTLMSFMALTMLSLLQQRLHNDGHLLDLDQIIEILGKMKVTKTNVGKSDAVYLVGKPIMNDRFYMLMDSSNPGFIELRLLGLAYFAILSAVDLPRLPPEVSKTTLAGCLRTKFPIKGSEGINI